MHKVCCLLFCFFGLQLFAQKSVFDANFTILKNSSTSDSAKAEAYRHLSYLYQAKDMDSALWYANRAIDLAKLIDNKIALANAIIQQASNYVWLNRKDEALKLYFEAIQIGNTISSQNVLLDAYSGIAYLYETTETWDKAWEYSKKCLEIAEKITDKSQINYAYHEMGSIHLGLNNFDAAESYLINAKTGFTEYKNIDRVATCCSDLGSLYVKQQKYEAAKVQFDSAIALYLDIDEPIQAAYVYEQCGELYIEMLSYTQANDYYKKALNIYNDSRLPADIARVNLGMGRVAFYRHDYDKASTLFKQAYIFFKNEKDNTQLLSVILFLAKADSALNNNADAFGYLAEYKSVADALNKQKTELQTREMMIEFDVEKKEKENLLLRQENASAKERSLFITIGGIVFLLAAFTMFLLYQQKNKINRQLKISQLKTEEAYQELKQVGQLKDKLFSIIAHDLRSPLANTQQLLHLTRSGAIDQQTFSQLAQELEINLDYNTELLHNLLNWAKTQMNGLVIDMKKIEVQKLVRENFSLFQGVAEKKKILLRNNVTEASSVFADENILRMALRNTISNAIKFSRPGKDVIIECLHDSKKSLIVVRDEGVGITEEQKQKMFSLESTSTRGTQQEQGAGIGLRITMEMIHKMGGNIWIESKTGEGTSVFLQVNRA